MIVFSVKNKTIYHRQENDFKLANRIIIKKGILGNNILKFITRLVRQLKYRIGYTLTHKEDLLDILHKIDSEYKFYKFLTFSKLTEDNDGINEDLVILYFGKKFDNKGEK